MELSSLELWFSTIGGFGATIGRLFRKYFADSRRLRLVHSDWYRAGEFANRATKRR